MTRIGATAKLMRLWLKRRAVNEIIKPIRVNFFFELINLVKK